MQKHRTRVVAGGAARRRARRARPRRQRPGETRRQFTKFAQCPYNNPEVKKCIYSVTNAAKWCSATKKVPIEKQVVLQGGYGAVEAGRRLRANSSPPPTASRSPKPRRTSPAGCLASCPKPLACPGQSADQILLRKQPDRRQLDPRTGKAGDRHPDHENNLAEEEGVALKMPVKVHLENPFLGKNCYVGSSSSPIIWNLTTGTPPAGAQQTDHRQSRRSRIPRRRPDPRSSKTTELVDNAWSAPGASGCGGILSFLVNPIINAQLGMPPPPGNNTAILKNTIMTRPLPSLSRKTTKKTLGRALRKEMMRR